jgi:FtsP/CotA-like multicopper oxidase with cupredoxin domain
MKTMNKPTLPRIVKATLALAVMAAFGGAAQAAVFPQFPAGCAADGSQPATVNPKVCRHLAAGDGWMSYGENIVDKSLNLPDGTPMTAANSIRRSAYMFGFQDVTGKSVGKTFNALTNEWSTSQVMTEGVFNAKWPAPTQVFSEGQELYIGLTNVGMAERPDLFDPHSIHYDGVPEGSMTINMGSTLTYYYHLNDPGTYMYHCHVESTEHMQMGMLGQLYVKPKQDGTNYTVGAGLNAKTYNKFVYNDGDGSTGYNVVAALQLGSFDANFHDLHELIQPLPFNTLRSSHPFINGRSYPDTIDTRTTTFDKTRSDRTDATTELRETSQPETSFVQATVGDRVLLRLSNLSVVDYFTVTAMGLNFRVVGSGAAQTKGRNDTGVVGKSFEFRTNSVTLGGGETADLIIDTAGLAKGTYTFYTTNLNFLSNGAEDRGGIMTHIVLN